MEIRFLGHAPSTLTEGDTTVLVDPFLTGNPKAAVSADEVDPTHILLTHGHADHLGDTVDIAKRRAPRCVAIVELAGELGEQRRRATVHDPNLGGTVEFDWGRVQARAGLAHIDHAEGTVSTPGGLRDQPRRQARLPPRRHRAVHRPAAVGKRGADRRSR